MNRMRPRRKQPKSFLPPLLTQAGLLNAAPDRAACHRSGGPLQLDVALWTVAATATRPSEGSHLHACWERFRRPIMASHFISPLPRHVRHRRASWRRPDPRPVPPTLSAVLAMIPSLPRPVIGRLTSALIQQMDPADATRSSQPAPGHLDSRQRRTCRSWRAAPLAYHCHDRPLKREPTHKPACSCPCKSDKTGQQERSGETKVDQEVLNRICVEIYSIGDVIFVVNPLQKGIAPQSGGAENQVRSEDCDAEISRYR